ncbi:MAG: RecQ family ATP-dependent DNA helicase [Gemmatimonas sp.]|nr:RecQ family ATP-dependent DNA helicase [Gemmatimonas sp.]
MHYEADRALELLRAGCALPEAGFREGQEEAIRQVVDGDGRLLVVQKTGWGKSFVYFIAAKLLREAGHGPALLISPLLALMRNQLAAAGRMGVRAATINSDNQSDWEQVEKAVARNEIDILLVSPERLANERFHERVLALVGARASLLVVDEAHCISDWGHDFRPHYRLVDRTIRMLPPNLRVLATTATANDRVVEDLTEVLGPELLISRGDLNRPSLLLQTIRLVTQAERLAWLAERLPVLPGSGIIYTLTKRDAETVAAWLRSRGLNVEAYTSDTGDLRGQLEEDLLANRVKALVATSALGMGYDKPDLHFVIHFQRPGSVVTYYQQVGRAGRAIDAAYGVLLSGDEDADITDYFINSAFPTPDEVNTVVDALEASPEGLTSKELFRQVNISGRRIENALQLLSLESPAPIVKEGSRWQLTVADLSEAFWDRARRLTQLRKAEQAEMLRYLELESGHMEFLLRALDGSPEAVVPPTIPPLSTEITEEHIREAEEFLRRTSIPIEPRRQWPAGGLPRYSVRGTIPTELRPSPGRALCFWRDAGWGRLVRIGKYDQGHFSDEILPAVVDLIGAWSPDPAPQWVASIPSLRHPRLVPGLARGLAEALGLPYHDVLGWTEERPEQRTMANGVQQALNLDGALAISGEVPSRPVLLVDDMVDSRWTFTIAGWLLRSAGSGVVYPLALSHA